MSDRWRPQFVQKAMDHPYEYEDCDCSGLEQHVPLAQVRMYVERLEQESPDDR